MKVYMILCTEPSVGLGRKRLLALGAERPNLI